MNYNTLKDKWNMNELHCMLVQEETRLKNQGNHSINILSHPEARKKVLNNKGKGKQGPLKVNESSAEIHKKDRKDDKCHFCNKPRYYKKDYQKHKA